MRRLARFAWNIGLTIVLGCSFAQGATELDLAIGEVVLEDGSYPDSHVEALGERGGIWGDTRSGFEAWAYPFQMFTDLTFTLRAHRGEWSEKMLPQSTRQIATPHLAQLKSEGKQWNATTTFFYPRSTEGGVLIFDITSADAVELGVHFNPSIRPQLMTREGELDRSWDPDRREVIYKDASRQAELRVGSPHAQKSVVSDDGSETIWLEVPRPEEGQSSSRVILQFALGDGLRSHSAEVMDRLRTRLPVLLASAARHYSKVLDRAPKVETPDPVLNRALQWSAIALDQFRVHNPFLGYGLVSGFSQSGKSDRPRPRYNWFFEEPTLTSWAFHRVGQSDHVAEALRFLQRYQREDGKTVHEVTQSLEYQPDFLSKFPYAYMHSDGPVYYLLAYTHYYRSTGDKEFIQAEWNRIRKTLEWCFSRVDGNDGLMTIDRGDWGTAESSTAVWKDTQLEGMWIRALADMEVLAELMEDPELGERCRKGRVQALESVEAKLWDETAGTYVWGIGYNQKRMGGFVPHHSVSFWLSSFDTTRVRRSLQQLAGSLFRTDWGVRTLRVGDSEYDPASYQKGAVWPVWNAGVIISDYRYGRSIEGFRNLRSMAALREFRALGSLPEVLHGDRYERLEEGVPHQMFSELAVVNGFYDGLLGLEVDVPQNRIQLAPALPPSWKRMTVDDIPVGTGRLDIKMTRTLERLNIDLRLDSPSGMAVRMRPFLPTGSRVTRVNVGGKPADYQVRVDSNGTWIDLGQLELKGRENLTVEIRHSGGVEMLPFDADLQAGELSRGLRVIETGLNDVGWRLVVEGRPERVYPIQIFTRRVPLRAFGARIVDETTQGFRVQLQAPGGSVTNAVGYARWETTVQFQ